MRSIYALIPSRGSGTALILAAAALAVPGSLRADGEPVQAALRRHADTRETVVVARESTASARQLVAYVVPRGAAMAEEDLRRHLSAQLPDYMVPSFFVALEALPLTPNGKVDRSRLPVPGPAQDRADYLAPRNPEETALARIPRGASSTAR